MPIDDATIHQLAKLTRIDVSANGDAPPPNLLKNLNAHVAWITNAFEDGDDILPPMLHVGDPQTWMRDDTPSEPLGTEVVLRNAPAHDQDHFLVPQVVDDNS